MVGEGVTILWGRPAGEKKMPTESDRELKTTRLGKPDIYPTRQPRETNQCPFRRETTHPLSSLCRSAII